MKMGMPLDMAFLAGLFSRCFLWGLQWVSSIESPRYIHRISLDRNYGAEPSYYRVYKKPMASGSEVLGLATLPAGTTFEVLKVLRCVNCYLDFGERVEAVVRFTSTNSFRDRKVKVSTDLLGDPFFKVPDPE